MIKMSVKTILLEFKVNSSERDNFTQEIINALKKRKISLNLLCSMLNKEDCTYDRFIYEGFNSVLNISWIKAATISRLVFKNYSIATLMTKEGFTIRHSCPKNIHISIVVFCTRH